MNELQQAEAHTILPVERLGNTLLVIPHGDLGSYSQRDFHTEFRRVHTLLDDPSLNHLIVDLSGSRYFGSEMLGALVALRERVIDRGGRAALTDVSRDMMAGLGIIRVDGLFEIFATRGEAVSALASLTVGQRVQRHRRPLRWALIFLAISGAVWGVHASKVGFQLFGSRPAFVYEQLTREWVRYDEQKQRWAPDEARTYRSTLLDRLASIENSLSQSRFIPAQERQWLQESVGHFQLFVRNESPVERTAFLRSMSSAHNLIVTRTALAIPQLELPDDKVSETSPGTAELSEAEPVHSDEALREDSSPDSALDASEDRVPDADQNTDTDSA